VLSMRHENVSTVRDEARQHWWARRELGPLVSLIRVNGSATVDIVIIARGVVGLL